MPYGGAVTWPYYDTTVYPRRGDALISFHEALEELQICPNIVGTSLGKLAEDSTDLLS